MGGAWRCITSHATVRSLANPPPSPIPPPVITAHHSPPHPASLLLLLHRCAQVGVTGMCRASCRDCRQCAAGDVLCQRYNMKSLVRARAMRAAAGVQAAAAAGQAAKA